MRIAGINPGTTPRFAGFTAEGMWMNVRNVEGSTAVRGACATITTAGDTYTDSAGNARPFGYDIVQANASTALLFLGAMHRDVEDDGFGEVQVWGYDDDTLVNVTNVSTPVPTNGHGILPTSGQWYFTGSGALATDDVGVIIEPAATIQALSVAAEPLGCFIKSMGI